MNVKGISESVIRRLPRYYRFLGELKTEGETRISSRLLSEKMGLTASQIRQDLNCFGGFGQQGYGYNIVDLQDEIATILGLDRPQSAILIGAGNLGRAVSMHLNFENRGFRLSAIFDRKEALVGQVLRGMPIRDVSSLDEFCRENNPAVAILCVPKSEAKILADQLIKLGIRGFWNFSHYDMSLDHPEAVVENIHLGDSLMTLSYRMHNKA